MHPETWAFHSGRQTSNSLAQRWSWQRYRHGWPWPGGNHYRLALKLALRPKIGSGYGLRPISWSGDEPADETRMTSYYEQQPHAPLMRGGTTLRYHLRFFRLPDNLLYTPLLSDTRLILIISSFPFLLSFVRPAPTRSASCVIRPCFDLSYLFLS